MRTITVIAAGILASSLALSAQRSGTDTPSRRGTSAASGASATERFSQRIRAGSNARVTLTNLSGAIVVSGGAGTDVSVEAVKSTRGNRELLDGVRIEVDERGGRVDIRTIYERERNAGRNEGVSVDYTVTIPAQASIDVTSISGSVTVANVKGTVAVKSTSGSLTLSGTSRIETAKTLSGSIDVSDATLEGDTAVSTASGSIHVRDVRARGLELKTVSGRIEATGLSSDRLDMTSLSGRLELTGRLMKDGRYNLGTHSGSVRVALSGATGFDLRASTFSGSIRSEFTMTRVDQSSRDDRGRTRGSRSLRGTVGDGSASLTIQTFSGSIVIERR